MEKFKIKKSKEGKDYQDIPILYEGNNARIRMRGRFKLKELHSDLSLLIQVDDDNRKLF